MKKRALEDQKNDPSGICSNAEEAASLKDGEWLGFPFNQPSEERGKLPKQRKVKTGKAGAAEGMSSAVKGGMFNALLNPTPPKEPKQAITDNVSMKPNDKESAATAAKEKTKIKETKKATKEVPKPNEGKKTKLKKSKHPKSSPVPNSGGGKPRDGGAALKSPKQYVAAAQAAGTPLRAASPLLKKAPSTSWTWRADKVLRGHGSLYAENNGSKNSDAAAAAVAAGEKKGEVECEWVVVGLSAGERLCCIGSARVTCLKGRAEVLGLTLDARDTAHDFQLTKQGVRKRCEEDKEKQEDQGFTEQVSSAMLRGGTVTLHAPSWHGALTISCGSNEGGSSSSSSSYQEEAEGVAAKGLSPLSASAHSSCPTHLLLESLPLALPSLLTAADDGDEANAAEKELATKLGQWRQRRRRLAQEKIKKKLNSSRKATLKRTRQEEQADGGHGGLENSEEATPAAAWLSKRPEESTTAVEAGGGDGGAEDSSGGGDAEDSNGVVESASQALGLRGFCVVENPAALLGNAVDGLACDDGERGLLQQIISSSSSSSSLSSASSSLLPNASDRLLAVAYAGASSLRPHAVGTPESWRQAVNAIVACHWAAMEEEFVRVCAAAEVPEEERASAAAAAAAAADGAANGATAAARAAEGSSAAGGKTTALPSSVVADAMACLVCGGKGVGKSSLARYLTHRLVSCRRDWLRQMLARLLPAPLASSSVEEERERCGDGSAEEAATLERGGAGIEEEGSTARGGSGGKKLWSEAGVLFLDLDVGQPEMTPSGLLSLNHLSGDLEPLSSSSLSHSPSSVHLSESSSSSSSPAILLGPPHTHLRPFYCSNDDAAGSEGGAERLCCSYYFGDSSPRRDPLRFLSFACSLANQARQFTRALPPSPSWPPRQRQAAAAAVRLLLSLVLKRTTPTVANCDGWGHGLGRNLLAALLRLVQPSHVVQVLNRGAHAKQQQHPTSSAIGADELPTGADDAACFLGRRQSRSGIHFDEGEDDDDDCGDGITDSTDVRVGGGRDSFGGNGTNEAPPPPPPNEWAAFRIHRYGTTATPCGGDGGASSLSSPSASAAGETSLSAAAPFQEGIRTGGVVHVVDAWNEEAPTPLLPLAPPTTPTTKVSRSSTMPSSSSSTTTPSSSSSSSTLKRGEVEDVTDTTATSATAAIAAPQFSSVSPSPAAAAAAAAPTDAAAPTPTAVSAADLRSVRTAAYFSLLHLNLQRTFHHHQRRRQRTATASTTATAAAAAAGGGAVVVALKAGVRSGALSDSSGSLARFLAAAPPLRVPLSALLPKPSPSITITGATDTPFQTLPVSPQEAPPRLQLLTLDDRPPFDGSRGGGFRHFFPDLLHSLNGSLVALLDCSGDPRHNHATRCGAVSPGPLLPPPGPRCLGLGIVRSVDLEWTPQPAAWAQSGNEEEEEAAAGAATRGCLYVLTPVPALVLRSCLSVGIAKAPAQQPTTTAALPSALLVDGGGSPSAWPYLHCESLAAPSAAVMKSRSNLQRGGGARLTHNSKGVI